ncbi:homeobox-containing protein 1-like [Antedon mediterranea]|uniref:homeobox-containing protein 1-like n=1 Tax=Antedon mediterranea TaxID=105859 RepID=UPI003AF650F9
MSQPRYTIEQYELLRRLRATGMTKEEMVAAITAMEKLDNDLGPSPEKRIQIKDVHTVPSPRVYQGTNDNQSVSSSAYPHQSSLHSSASQSPVQIPSSVVQHQSSVLNMHAGSRSSDLSQVPSNMFVVSNSVPSQETPMDVEAEAEFNRLISHDPNKLWEDIKMFILSHDISQSWLSKELGIQKGILSHYLLTGRGLTKVAVKLLYTWYHLSNRGNVQSQQSRVEGQTARPVFGRRDRLHWTEKELQVLETYRKENAYPSMNEVRTMADTLNSLSNSVEDLCTENRVITPMNVYNWFANRRKRKAKEITSGQASDASVEVESLDSVDDQLSPNAENVSGSSTMPTNTDFFAQIANNSQRNTDTVESSMMPIPVTLEMHGGSLKDEGQGFSGHVRSLLEN